jgi:hypothetical protein
VNSADLVITDLADEVAELREQAALARAYRAEAFEAIERLGEKMRELEQALRQNAILRHQLLAVRQELADKATT